MEQMDLDIEDMEDEEVEVQQPVFAQQKDGEYTENQNKKESAQQTVSPMKKVDSALKEQKMMISQLVDYMACQEKKIQKLLEQTESIIQKMELMQIGALEKNKGVKSIFKVREKKKKVEEKAELLKLLQQVDFGEDQLEQIQKGIDDGLSIEEIKVYAVKQKSAVQMQKIREMYRKIKGEENE